jgi:hypothetical protein
VRLEDALDDIGHRADELLKKANALKSGLQRLRTASDAGNLRQLQESIRSACELAGTIRDQLVDPSQIWNFNAVAYLSSPAFRSELIETASKHALELIACEGDLLAFPLTVTILPTERAVRINRERTIKLRPSRLVATLKALQSSHGPFTAAEFIRVLLTGYKSVLGQDPSSARMGKPVPLAHVYKALTPLPGQSSRYSVEAFTLDIYRLNESGVRTIDRPSVTLDLGGGRPPWLEIVTPEGKKRFGTVSFVDKR